MVLCTFKLKVLFGDGFFANSTKGYERNLGETIKTNEMKCMIGCENKKRKSHRQMEKTEY